jgi:zinc protease
MRGDCESKQMTISQRWTWLIAAALAAGPMLADAGRADPHAGTPISHFTLANGLELVIIPDRRAPVVTHMIWYKVGSADEPAGKSGIAHFLEHLMFKGTAKFPNARFSETVATIGGQENAFTSTDYTGYYQRVPRDKLATVMEFEADRMTGLVLTDAVVLPERDVILEEQNQRVANSPYAQLNEEVQAALYRNHPYGKPIIGWRHEMETLDRDDALAFYRRFYTPNNAIVVIAGDVVVDEVKALAEQTYGKIERRSEISNRQRPQEPEQRSPRTVTLADPRVAQPSLQRNYAVPSYASSKRNEGPALDVLANILGGGSNSRIYQALVIDKGIAVNAGAWYQGSALDMARFGVYGTPKDGTTLPQLEAAIDVVIAEFIAKGVTAEELQRTKTKLVADAVYAQDSQATLARWYGVGLTTGSTVEDVREWPKRIAAVTADEVQAAARNWLDRRRSVTGYLIKGEKPREERRS